MAMPIKKKKIVILTGAGADLPWGGPSTTELTKAILNDRKFLNASGKRFGRLLYDTLSKPYSSDEYAHPSAPVPNFESILNLIEYLYIYYNSFPGMRNIYHVNDSLSAYMGIHSGFKKEL